MPSSVGVMADSYNKPAAAGIPMTGLVGWYDASNTASFTFSTGNSVSQWNDLSGNNKHATWVNSSWPATRVAGAINGLHALDPHPGSLSTSLLQPPQPFTMITAVKTGAVSGNVMITGVGNQAPVGCVSWDVNNGTVRLLKQASALVGQATSVYTASTPTVLGVTYAADNVWTHYRNGVAVGSGTTAVTFTTGLFLGLGANAVPNVSNYDGLLGEFVVYNRVLTTPERQQVESYLRSKWNTP